MKKINTNLRLPDILMLISGLVAIVVGIVVLFGWHTSNLKLLQAHSGFVPMRYQSAVGFVFCGFSLLAITFASNRWAIIGAAYALIIGLSTLAEYIFGINLGIDL
ncbi:MAG: hypothetical protein PHN57_02815, partial [Candidatus Omnitrophica bacterium]|nr:hypothetical protein [Candidatus Omnitrophota bacterium]